MKNRNLSFILGMALFIAPILRADIYGSNPTVNLGILDGCNGCLFAYVPFPGTAAGQTVTSYQFYNAAGAGTTNSLTPVMLEQVNSSTFDVLAISEASTGFAGGYNSLPFVLTGGSAKVVDSSTFFGYLDGYIDGSGNVHGNTGTIPSNYPTGPGQPGYFSGYFSPIPLPLKVGVTIDTFWTYAEIPQSNRTYSLQVTTPEPSTYLILAMGLGSVLLVGLRVGSRA